MEHRRIPFYCAVLFVSTAAMAADQSLLTHTHRGTIVTISADKLVAQGLSEKKKEHTYDVASTVTVICEGKPCQLSNLKVGDLVIITTEKPQDGKALATKIEAKKVGSGTESP